MAGLAHRPNPPCGPVDIEGLWERLERWLRHEAPVLAGNLAPGATSAQIEQFERAIGRDLPDEVRTSVRIHNGQQGDWWENSVFCGLYFLSLEEALRQWRAWQEVAADIPTIRELDSHCREYGTSSPDDAIRLAYVNPNWIPLVNIAQSDHLGVDLDPGPGGYPAQVINFGRDQEEKMVVGWSWGWFLHDLVDELERGNFRLPQPEDHQDDDEEGDEDPPALVLRDPAPPAGLFENAMREWSRAKIGGRRPFIPSTIDPAWCRENVLRIAQAIRSERAPNGLPILADALEEAGCSDREVLDHCRQPGEHVRGCWVVDLILGKK